MLRELFQEVLDLASDYQSEARQNPQMSLRQQHLKDAKELVATWLTEDLAGTQLADLDLRVEVGGQVGNYAPVPWLRIYSPEYSPKATRGFYVVWLFAASGERLYLSLNQGTSEWRGNKWRARRDTEGLIATARDARDVLGDAYLDALPRAATVIDLDIDAVTVSPDSVDNMRNYEFANILSVEYTSNRLPDDQELRTDVNSAVSLLSYLYENAGPSPARPDSASDSASRPRLPRRSRGQGRGTKEENDAVDLRAMAVVQAHFRAEGWEVDNVARYNLPYDFICTRDGDELFVEIKGLRGEGDYVEVSGPQVRHAREYPNQSALAVVDSIVLEQREAGPVGQGGFLRVIFPWIPDDQDLTITKYRYRVTSSRSLPAAALELPQTKT